MIFKRHVIGCIDDELPAHLLNVGSRGVDRAQFEKLAREECPLPDIRPEKGFAHIHLVTLGAGDYYGPNNNADYFPEGPSRWVFPLNGKEASLEGGLTECHKTYMEYGAVYHHHNNSRKGFEKQGEVVWERYSPTMHRGEVVIRVSEDLRDSDGKLVWEDTLQKIASNIPAPFSQGSSVPFDVCSWCGNEAETRDAHCDHIKNSPLAFLKTGEQAYMINHKAFFHDISRVGRPADRIALTLQKVAGEGSSFVECSSEGAIIPVALVDKLAGREAQDRYRLLRKMAAMEKEIPMIPREVVEPLAASHRLSPCDEAHVVEVLKDIPEDILINCLNKRNSMLTPRTFTIIVLKKQPDDIPGFDSVEDLMEGVFGEILENGDPNDILSDGSYRPICPAYSAEAERRTDEVSGLLGVDPDKVTDRVVKIAIRPATGLSKKAAEPTVEAGLIAKEYAKYQLSFLASGKPDAGRERYVASVNRRI